MPLVRPVGESKPLVVFTAWFVRMLLGMPLVFDVPFVAVPVVLVRAMMPNEAVLVAPPVIVTPAPPVPPRAVPVVTIVG